MELENRAKERISRLAVIPCAVAALAGLLLVASSQGCSSFGDAEAGSNVDDVDASATSDASTSGDGAPDSQPPPSRACSDDTRFDTVAPLVALNTDNDESGARLTDDELTVYFDRGPIGGDRHVQVAHRSSAGTKFDPPTPFTSTVIPGGISAAEVDPWVSPEELQIFYSARVKSTMGGDRWQLKEIHRNGVADTWSTPADVAIEQGGNWARQPFVARYGSDRELWFTLASIDGNADPTSSMIVRGSLPSGEPLVGLATDAAVAGAPVLSRDGLTLYFASSSAKNGRGVTIHRISRTSTTLPFDAATGAVDLELFPEETSELQGPTWISADGCRLHFTRRDPISPTSNAQLELYVATRTPK